MEPIVFNRRSDGKLIIGDDQKEKVLGCISEGHSPAEVARFYGLRIQLLLKWRRDAARGAIDGAPRKRFSVEQNSVPVMEYRRLWEENQKLRKALANAVLDRDILKEAVDIAAKKKWI